MRQLWYAIKIGLEVLAALDFATGVPLPVNFSWKVGGRRFRLKGEVLAEKLD